MDSPADPWKELREAAEEEQAARIAHGGWGSSWSKRANPAAILALLAERERLSAVLNEKNIDDEMRKLAVSFTVKAHMMHNPDNKWELEEVIKEVKREIIDTFITIAKPYLNKANAAEAALRKSEERAGNLEKALEPFSRVAEALDDPSWSEVDELHLRSEDDFLLAKLPFGSFRIARATLTNEATDD
jgi:vacuolar-type H+-ATPase subunit I/STV1